MTSIGETLRSERLRRNLELHRISEDLKISPRLLEAMEADRFDKLPGGVFTRSFVRQYARCLGLDEQEIASSLDRMLNPPSVQPEVAEARPRPTADIALPRVKNWMSASDSRMAWASSLRALALVIVVALGCAAVYSWSQRRQRTVDVHNNAAVAAPIPKVAQSVPAAPDKAADKTSGKLNPTPANATPEAGSAERVAVPVRLQLTADQPVWVQATTDGKQAFSGTIQPHGTQIIEANDRVLLKLGNAGGVRVELNGKPVGTLGNPGEVLRVQFTSGGFQIVPAEAPTPDDGPSEPGDSPGEPLASPL
jgi:cytoskeleton protein RodZ